MTHLLYCDGASRGNPGKAAYGFVLLDGSGRLVAEGGETLGTTTNNVAEYRGLVAGLEAAAAAGVSELEVRLDSLLLVRQVSGDFRVKAAGLKPWHRQAVGLLARIGRARVVHIPREQNSRADALANAALDGMTT